MIHTCTYCHLVCVCNYTIGDITSNHLTVMGFAEHCQEVCMHADGVRRCCVWIHTLCNYNTQQSSKHVHGVSGECDQAQEGSNCHYQLPSLLFFKLAATRTNEIRMNSHYECRAVHTPTHPPTQHTHTSCVPMYCTCKQLSINTVVIIIHILVEWMCRVSGVNV